MHPTSRPRRTASSRGGFTLVELLVVIGIIAILAGVALGPITNGIKKAQQSSGVQEAHAIGLAMYSCANDNQQLYPDTSNPPGNTGTAAAAPAHALLAGGYVTDPSIFYLSSDSLTAKYTGTVASAASTISNTAISWDFVGNGGTGVSSVNYPSMPILWSTVGGASVTYGTATSPITVTPTLTTLPYQTTGMAVFFENNSAQFITANPNGLITMVTGPNNSGISSAPTTLSGQ
jgi:prepilin-type N-terminal cleavage/methylation domain-containing protein